MDGSQADESHSRAVSALGGANEAVLDARAFRRVVWDMVSARSLSTSSVSWRGWRTRINWQEAVCGLGQGEAGQLAIYTPNFKVWERLIPDLSAGHWSESDRSARELYGLLRVQYM
jgi:hypothetical protein